MSKELKKVDPQGIVVPDGFSVEKLLSQAIDKGVTVDTMERLLAMRRELKKEHSEEAFNSAMAMFQAECPVIKKEKSVQNKDGNSVRYKFAPLDSIVKQTKDIIRKHGFSYTFDTIVEGLTVKAICKVTHDQGHSETSQFQVSIDGKAFMNEQQKFASALTFAKRYAFCNAFGILTGDDDNDGKSNDKVEASSYEKVLGLIKSSKIVGNLIKIDELIVKDKTLTEDQKKSLAKMIRDKVSQIENNG